MKAYSVSNRYGFIQFFIILKYEVLICIDSQIIVKSIPIIIEFEGYELRNTF